MSPVARHPCARDRKVASAPQRCSVEARREPSVRKPAVPYSKTPAARVSAQPGARRGPGLWCVLPGGFANAARAAASRTKLVASTILRWGSQLWKLGVHEQTREQTDSVETRGFLQLGQTRGTSSKLG